MIADPGIDRYYEVFLARRKVSSKGSKSRESENIETEVQKTVSTSSSSEETKSELSNKAPILLPASIENSDVGSFGDFSRPKSGSISQQTMTDEEKDDLNNGALLVHSVAKGRPNLEKFMNRLQEAMDQAEDPVVMSAISKRYHEARKSKVYSKPP